MRINIKKTVLSQTASALAMALAAPFALPTAAFAAAPEAASDMADDQGILVIGEAEGYKADTSNTATKTDTPLIDTPQSITVVTREQLDDQSMHSIGDVLRYVPGTTVGQGEGNRDQITLRGQNTTADFFLDGMRDDTQYYRGLYNIERVEVLKGPFAMIFGRGGSGGVINRVQKVPVAGDGFMRVKGSVNSFGGWDVATDINGPLGEGAAFRINATYEAMDSFRDYVDGHRIAFNPYVAFDLGKWQLGLSYEYLHDDRVPDRGVPSIATTSGQPNRPLTGQRDTFFGIPGVNQTEIEAHIVKARLDSDLTDNLHWSSSILYGDYDKYYTNVFANGAVNTATNTVALGAYTDPTQRQNFIAQSQLVWDVQTGGIGHRLLAGVEYNAQETTNARRNGTLSSGTVNLSNIVYPTVTFGALSRSTRSDVTVFSAFVQDQVSLSEHFDVVLGLRYDSFDIEGRDLIANRDFGRKDEKLSPRVGLIVKPQENISLYGSYSQSFQPRSGDQFLSLSTTTENLAPEKFTNLEVGAKWDVRPDLSVTVALFQLDRTNATTPDPNNITATINIGETRVRGIELGVAGRITPEWQMSGGYTHQDGTLRSNDFVVLGQLPRHQFALWNRYQVTDSVGLGVGVVHQSSQYAALRTSTATTRLPAFTRVDAAAYWTVSEDVGVQLNVENLFDERYFADAHNVNNITPGAPLNGRLTVKFGF